MSKDTSSFHVVMARVLIKEAWKVTTEIWDVMENRTILQQMSTASLAFPPYQGKLQLPRTSIAMRIRGVNLSSFWIPDVKISLWWSRPSHLIENLTVIRRLTSKIPAGNIMCYDVFRNFTTVFNPYISSQLSLWHFTLVLSPAYFLSSYPCWIHSSASLLISPVVCFPNQIMSFHFLLSTTYLIFKQIKSTKSN